MRYEFCLIELPLEFNQLWVDDCFVICCFSGPNNPAANCSSSNEKISTTMKISSKPSVNVYLLNFSFYSSVLRFFFLIIFESVLFLYWCFVTFRFLWFSRPPDCLAYGRLIFIASSSLCFFLILNIYSQILNLIYPRMMIQFESPLALCFL